MGVPRSVTPLLLFLALIALSCQKFGTGESSSPSASDGGGVDASSPSSSLVVDGGDAAGQLEPCGVAQPCDVRCDGARCESCAAILAVRPGSPSRVYAVAKRNDIALPLVVYCDMISFGGGWLLVGRSVENADTNRMGWRIDDGSPFNDQLPYSLDTQKLAFTPTEMIFGSRAAKKEWGPNVYKTPLPTNFIASFGNLTANIESNRVAVKGSCGGGNMQSFIGHTSKQDNFFFRDNTGADKYGLRSDGWEANSDETCTGGGLLSAEQGMIFVR